MSHKRDRLTLLGRVPDPVAGDLSIPPRVRVAECHKPVAAIRATVQRHCWGEGRVDVTTEDAKRAPDAIEAAKEQQLQEYHAQVAKRAAGIQKELKLRRLQPAYKLEEVRARVQARKQYSAALERQVAAQRQAAKPTRATPAADSTEGVTTVAVAAAPAAWQEKEPSSDQQREAEAAAGGVVAARAQAAGCSSGASRQPDAPAQAVHDQTAAGICADTIAGMSKGELEDIGQEGLFLSQQQRQQDGPSPSHPGSGSLEPIAGEPEGSTEQQQRSEQQLGSLGPSVSHSLSSSSPVCGAAAEDADCIHDTVDYCHHQRQQQPAALPEAPLTVLTASAWLLSYATVSQQHQPRTGAAAAGVDCSRCIQPIVAAGAVGSGGKVDDHPASSRSAAADLTAKMDRCHLPSSGIQQETSSSIVPGSALPRKNSSYSSSSKQGGLSKEGSYSSQRSSNTSGRASAVGGKLKKKPEAAATVGGSMAAARPEWLDAAVLASLQEKVAKGSLFLPALCTCPHSEGILDPVYPSTCCINCPLHRNQEAYGRLLKSVLCSQGLI